MYCLKKLLLYFSLNALLEHFFIASLERHNTKIMIPHMIAFDEAFSQSQAPPLILNQPYKCNRAQRQ